MKVKNEVNKDDEVLGLLIEADDYLAEEETDDQGKKLTLPIGTNYKRSNNKSLPDLPNEIWIQILGYLEIKFLLTNVALVSKRFYALANTFSVKKIAVQFTNDCKKPFTITFDSINFQCENVAFVMVHAPPIMKKFHNCQILEEMLIFGQNQIMTQLDLRTLPQMPMKKLILKDVHVHSRYLSKFISDLNKTKLECLVLKNCDGINDKVLLEMSRLNFPKLKRFFVYINDTNMASVPNCINNQLDNWPFLKSITIISRKRLISHLEILKLTTKINCNVFITDYDCKSDSPNSQKIVEEYFDFAYKFNLNHLTNNFFHMKKEYDHWCEQNVDWN